MEVRETDHFLIAIFNFLDGLAVVDFFAHIFLCSFSSYKIFFLPSSEKLVN